MDKFALEILKIDQDGSNDYATWAKLVELYCQEDLEQEQVKHMKQCVALIGDL